MRIRILGSGDAFGSGGRLHTCFLVERGERSFLVDCGASSLIAMRKSGVDPNAIDSIILSHLHGDHYGGLPFFILEAQFVSRRKRPLVIAGPPGLGPRLDALMEAMFPGSASADRDFRLELVEIAPEASVKLTSVGAEVTAYLVSHPSGTPALALRILCDGKILAYTGDTEWVDTIAATGRDADLLIAECYGYDKPVPYHLDLAVIRRKIPDVGAKRVLLTHLSAAMLAHVSEITDFEIASDGLDIEI